MAYLSQKEDEMKRISFKVVVLVFVVLLSISAAFAGLFESPKEKAIKKCLTDHITTHIRSIPKIAMDNNGQWKFRDISIKTRPQDNRHFVKGEMAAPDGKNQVRFIKFRATIKENGFEDMNVEYFDFK